RRPLARFGPRREGRKMRLLLPRSSSQRLVDVSSNTSGAWPSPWDVTALHTRHETASPGSVPSRDLLAHPANRLSIGGSVVPASSTRFGGRLGAAAFGFDDATDLLAVFGCANSAASAVRTRKGDDDKCARRSQQCCLRS